MNWYLQTGKNSDVVLNSKIIYSRNLRNFKFGTDNLKEIQEIEDEVKSKIPSLGYNLNIQKINGPWILPFFINILEPYNSFTLSIKTEFIFYFICLSNR